MKNFRIGRLEVRLADYFALRASEKLLRQTPDVLETPGKPVSPADVEEAKAYLQNHVHFDIDAFLKEQTQDYQETLNFMRPLFRWHPK